MTTKAIANQKVKKSKKVCKYVFVVGGVISGVGKGITASSIGKILQDHGLIVTALKIDPYVNIDAGTMNPTEHGEVFVTNDGDETDQDMGNYERFLNTDIGSINYMTTGRVYQSVINRERNLEYGGQCVQVVPHVPMEVVRRIKHATSVANADVAIIEIGGTVGEYENILFLEAARILKLEDPKSVAFVMVSYLPIPSKIGEMKTKPTQHAVRILNSSGIQPDIIIARAQLPLDHKRKEKIAFFCNVPANHIISAPDIDSVYDVPGNFEKDGLSKVLFDVLNLPNKKAFTKQHKHWVDFAKSVHVANTKTNTKDIVKIAVIGKYFDTGDFTLSDSYLSVIEAIKYSAYAVGKKPILTWLSSTIFEADKNKLKDLKKYDGIVVPGGFGSRGIEGKILAIEYARKNKIPYFGLCYGMQLMVIEYARNVLGLSDANTTEVNKKTKNNIVDIMESQKQNIAKSTLGGSMRLGAYECVIKKGSIAHNAYGKLNISERHRHRYEVNNEYVDRLESAGLNFSGKSPNGDLCEIAELPANKHPFFVGVQFHPEFMARPLAPHPLFTAFIEASVKKSKK